MNIRQALIPALMVECQTLEIEAQQMQKCRVEIRDRDNILHRSVAERPAWQVAVRAPLLDHDRGAHRLFPKLGVLYQFDVSF